MLEPIALLAQISSDPNQFNGYLILAYAIMWLTGVVYVISLLARQRNARQDLDVLRQVLEDEDA